MNESLEESKTVLPPPIEIAKIAAVLIRGGEMDRSAAIDQAIALCFHADSRYAQLVDLPLDQIIMKLADPTLVDLALENLNRPKKLRLYPNGAKLDPETKIKFFQGGLDPVRNYLSKQASNLHWNTSRTVREAIELFHLDRARIHNEKNMDAIRSLERKHRKMAKERGQTFDFFRNGMHIPPDQLRLDGPAMFDQFMQGCAVWDKGESEGSGQNHGLNRRGHVLYWEIEQPFLNKLVRWRLDVKKRGGIKAVAKALRKYWAHR